MDGNKEKKSCLKKVDVLSSFHKCIGCEIYLLRYQLHSTFIPRCFYVLKLYWKINSLPSIYFRQNELKSIRNTYTPKTNKKNSVFCFQISFIYLFICSNVWSLWLVLNINTCFIWIKVSITLITHEFINSR